MPRVMITEASKFTLMLGLQTFIGNNYAQEWGAFAPARWWAHMPMVANTSDPAGLHRRRPDGRVGEGIGVDFEALRNRVFRKTRFLIYQ